MEEEDARLLRIFEYERSHEGSSKQWDKHRVILEKGPGGEEVNLFPLDFKNYISNIRQFRREEIIEGRWVKIGDRGQSTFVKCNPDGSLTETSSFSPFNSWQGKWTLVGRALRFNISKYELHIYAKFTSNDHSGIETDGSGNYTYFRFIKLAS